MAYDTKVAESWGGYVQTGTGQQWDCGVVVYEDVSLRTSERCYYRVVCQAYSTGAMDVHAQATVGATNDSDGYWDGTFANGSKQYFTFYEWYTWYGRDHAARKVSFWASFTVTGGFGNGTSEATATVTMPVKPSWTVSYDANGGFGAPGSQTKWASETLTLSSTRPTRTGYTFQGWATSASGAASYQPGGSYATDAALALHAVWRQTYSPPSATLAAMRVASASATAESPTGGYVRASLAWSVDASANSSNAAKSVTCRHRVAGGTWASVTPSGTTEGKSGTAVAAFAADASSPHEVELTVTDALGGSTTRSATVGAAAIPIDVANQGRGVGILAAAPSEGLRLGGLTLTGVASSSVASRPVSGLLRLLDLAALTQGWTYLWKSSSSAGDYVRWRMLMGVVHLEVCHVQGVGADGWRCGTLPASARLPYDLYHPMASYHDDHTAMAWVGGSNGTNPGEVWLYNNGSNHMYGMASWPVYNS